MIHPFGSRVYHTTKKGVNTVRFNDVQDTRKAEVKREQRNEAFRKMYDDCLEKLSAFYNKEKMTVAFGATFTL